MNKLEQLVLELREKYTSLSLLESISIKGNKHQRVVTCFCGDECKVSLVPHLRKKHPDVWAEWGRIFVELKNLGFSSKKTIDVFRVQGRFLFSWSTVESELLTLLEQDSSLLLPSQTTVKNWEPEEFKLESTTVWSFPVRGSWAVHKNNYRGNWPPELVRNILLKYTAEGDTVLDVFAGGGTTLIEAWLLSRRSFGIDISPIAIQTCSSSVETMQINANLEKEFSLEPTYYPIVILGNSKNCKSLLSKYDRVDEEKIDLIFAHPPYLNVLHYSKNIEGELSLLKNVDDFLDSLEEILASAVTCLKPNGRLALLIGDVRKKGQLIPLGFLTIDVLKKLGMELEHIIIKNQHRDTSTNLYKNHKSLDYLISHEYLLIAKKI